VLSLFTLSFEHSPKSVLSLYILSLKQLLFRSLKSVLSLCANDIICLVESKTDDTDEILLPGYIF
jgi:hypothetical protein